LSGWNEWLAGRNLGFPVAVAQHIPDAIVRLKHRSAVEAARISDHNHVVFRVVQYGCTVYSSANYQVFGIAGEHVVYEVRNLIFGHPRELAEMPIGGTRVSVGDFLCGPH
jgi:hypothetical protein